MPSRAITSNRSAAAYRRMGRRSAFTIAFAAAIALAALAAPGGATPLGRPANNPCTGPRSAETCPRWIAYNIFVIYNAKETANVTDSSGHAIERTKTIFWSMRSPGLVKVYRPSTERKPSGDVSFIVPRGKGVLELKTESTDRWKCGFPAESLAASRSETIRAAFSRGPELWVVGSTEDGPFARQLPAVRGRRSVGYSGYTCKVRFSDGTIDEKRTITVDPSSSSDTYSGFVDMFVPGEDRKQATFSLAGKFGDDTIWARGHGMRKETSQGGGHHLSGSTKWEWTWVFRFTKRGNP